jgi:hypothetical protein
MSGVTASTIRNRSMASGAVTVTCWLGTGEPDSRSTNGWDTGTNGIDLTSSISSMRKLASQRLKRNNGSWSELRYRGSDFPAMIWVAYAERLVSLWDIRCWRLHHRHLALLFGSNGSKRIRSDNRRTVNSRSEVNLGASTGEYEYAYPARRKS